MRRGAVALATLALGVAPAGASAATQRVDVQFSTFSPTALDVLPGDTVEWSNISERRHTVTADDGTFDSGDLLGGEHFSRAFTSVGRYAYHCTVHPGMIGEVDVRRVTLETLPPAVVLPGTAVEFAGRTATPGRPVSIQRKNAGVYRSVGTAKPAANGSWKATLPARTTGDYRAAVGSDVSETRRLLVSDRKVYIRATRQGVAVSVTPPAPYARIELQLDLRERFGWWPERHTRLDYVSRAEFTVRRPARVRVAMVARDGWTPIAVSRALLLR